MKKKKSLFTLIELLVVVGIIAILAGILIVGINSAIESSKALECKTQLSAVSEAYKAYEMYYGTTPKTDSTEGLAKILKAIDCGSDEETNYKKMKFLDLSILSPLDDDNRPDTTKNNVDMWGREVKLEGDGTHDKPYILHSPGPNGDYEDLKGKPDVNRKYGDDVFVMWTDTDE